MEKSKTAKYISGFLLLIVLAFVLFLLDLSMGSSSLSPADALGVLTGANNDRAAVRIVMDIRLPRALAAVLLGGALSTAGFLLQSFFRNPIAGPFVLGISSGAKLTVAAVMIAASNYGFLLGSAAMVGAAFVGAAAAMLFILLISGRVKNMAQLIITGIMVGYVCSAVTELAVNFADDSNIVNLHNWSMGSFSGIKTGDTGVMAAIVLLAFFGAFMFSKPISAYSLGEAYAENMGVNIRVFRVVIILLSSLLSACVTAFAGPVSFVGVAVPHLVKALFNTSKPLVIIPAAFLGGSCFCMCCDLAARMLFAPRELSVSTVTAFFGAPVVIWIMLKRDKK
ncbi:MAG: iron ABC transporter permease [Firmicutes bacterium]|nr:iron ABC transporter permease [Bacillota bacterium]